MRIQRYIAKDMRSALAQVREALGPDAVILSSGRVGDDVEVVAAIDMEVARAVENAPPATRVTRQHADYVAQERAHNVHERAEAFAPRAAAAAAAEARQRRTADDAPRFFAAFRIAGAGHRGSGAAAGASRPHRPAGAGRRDEGHAPHARGAARDAGVERHVAPLAGAGRHAQGTGAARHDAGSGQLAGAQDSRRNLPFSAARRFALATVARTIQVTGDRWLEKGGVVAFAGPAGAGKTTLLAKLAARWVLRHGPRRVAIISADAVRIGAHEQMHMLGRLLGVTTHNVFDVAELPELLYELRGYQFVHDRHRGREPARSGAGAPPAPAEPDAGQHRNLAGAARQHPGRRHRRSGAALRARQAHGLRASPRWTRP